MFLPCVQLGHSFGRVWLYYVCLVCVNEQLPFIADGHNYIDCCWCLYVAKDTCYTSDNPCIQRYSSSCTSHNKQCFWLLGGRGGLSLKIISVFTCSDQILLFHIGLSRKLHVASMLTTITMNATDNEQQECTHVLHEAIVIAFLCFFLSTCRCQRLWKLTVWTEQCTDSCTDSCTIPVYVLYCLRTLLQKLN